MRFINQKYEAVIFDLGGTLIYGPTWADYTAAAREMAKVLSAPTEDFLKLWFEQSGGLGTGILDYQTLNKQVCEQLGIDINEDDINEAAVIPCNVTKRRVMIPREGAIELLTYLKSNDYKIGLISDCASDLPIIWKDTPFAPLIDVTVFSCSAGMNKADPRIFRMALKELDVNPENCLYIADGIRQELANASKLGMQAIRIYVPDEIEDTPLREKWDGPEITSLSEVLNLLGE